MGKLFEGIFGEKGKAVGRAVDSFLNPGTLKKIDNSELEKEITRLNQVQSTNVTPPAATKVVSYTDSDGNEHLNQRLTEEQYQTLAQTQGQTAKRIISDIISSENYAAMTDEQKAKAVDLVYSYTPKRPERSPPWRITPTMRTPG